MDENFNNEQMNYDQNGDYITTDFNRFENQVFDHMPEDQQKAKTSLELGLISLFGSLACLFVYFFLNRMIFVMAVTPVIAVGGIVLAVKTIINDKGLPKAYIGLVLSIIGLLPSLLCTLVFFLDIFAGIFMK
ncbi:MAG: hypothetical protein K5776_06860 [Lachnospiraceae bacterium]|nr:hypothetical protein [Lachnospiraceae bacterium]